MMGGPPQAAPMMGGIPPGPPPPQPSAGMGGPESAALPRLLFSIEQSLETLARALPGESGQQLAALKDQLREIVSGALAGQTPQPGSTPANAGGPY